ncbi:hypothetical protein AB0O91_00275 [Kitasatospora sp. NPDC089797]|uniref:hypothetical protein n=1 Tax=Kitasatospora sp. NPDC089797 TaxID=3155298 RepID=UPI0034400496
MHAPLFDPRVGAGQLIAILFKRIKNHEQPDGTWPVLDVTATLFNWLTEIGVSVSGDADIPAPDCPAKRRAVEQPQAPIHTRNDAGTGYHRAPPPATRAATTKEDQAITQPDRKAAATPQPATVHELRATLSRYGLPGDRDLFERDLAVALDTSLLDDLAAVAEVIATYRHRLIRRTSPEAKNALAAPADGQRWTPASEALARLRAAGGDR